MKSRIMNARAVAVRHLADQTAPLLDGPVSALDFWARGLRESYRTELRPEASEARSLEIVARYQERYDSVMATLFGPANAHGLYTLPASKNTGKTRFKWFLRRFIGKPMTAVRVINNAATFDGGIDYVLRKLHNHSGVTIEVSKAQRRHPVLWSPVLGWKLWRKGAFR